MLHPLPPSEPQGAPVVLIVGFVGVIAVVGTIVAAMVLSL
jgi:hypothetical protein